MVVSWPIVWGLCLAGTMFALLFFYPMQLLLWWVVGGVVDFQECIWCCVLHPSGCSHNHFWCQVPVLESGLSGELAGEAMTLHLVQKPCCLEMESEGKWEKGRWKMSVVWPNREVEGWGRVKSTGVQMFPFLPLILSFVLYTLLFFFKLLFLISSGVSSWPVSLLLTTMLMSSRCFPL